MFKNALDARQSPERMPNLGRNLRQICNCTSDVIDTPPKADVIWLLKAVLVFSNSLPDDSTSQVPMKMLSFKMLSSREHTTDFETIPRWSFNTRLINT